MPQERLVIDDGYDLPDLDLDGGGIQYAIDRAAWDQAETSLAIVERRMLEGEDRVEVMRPGGGVAVYEIPAWRKHPVRRFKIARARRKETRG
jgi:hypothetical protein